MARLERFDRVDRRTFVRQLSRTAFGFVILGSAAAACSSDDPADGGTGASATSGAPDPEPSGTSTEVGAGRAGWQTVDLGFVAAYVLVRDGEAVIVDTGTSGSEDAIVAVLEEASSGWDSVSDVILTHRHPDHVGSVPAVLEAATGATAWAGAEDIPAITSPRELSAVSGGEDVAGLEIVATPGHTAGHISVLDRDAQVLVAGDALNGDGSGGLAGPNPEFSQDMDRAWASVEALAQRADGIASILPGHGGAVADDAAAKLRDLAAARG